MSEHYAARWPAAAQNHVAEELAGLWVAHMKSAGVVGTQAEQFRSVVGFDEDEVGVDETLAHLRIIEEVRADDDLALARPAAAANDEADIRAAGRMRDIHRLNRQIADRKV